MPKSYFNAEALEKIFADCVALGKRKNHDYGAVRDTISDNGVRGVVTRMDDKQARLLSLTSPGHEAAVTDESLPDTFRDMINYAAYGLILLQGTWGVQPPDPEHVQKWGKKFESADLRTPPPLMPHGRCIIPEMLEPAHRRGRGGWMEDSDRGKDLKARILANHNRKVKERADARRPKAKRKK